MGKLMPHQRSGVPRPHRLFRAIWAGLASLTLVFTGTGAAFATSLDGVSDGNDGSQSGALESEVTENSLADDDQLGGEDSQSGETSGRTVQGVVDQSQQRAAIEPFAAAGTASVTVTARVVSPDDASNTSGIGFTLYDGNTPTPYTCQIADNAGQCTITVPEEGLGKAYRVVQTSTPSSLFANPKFWVQGPGGGVATATREINYAAGNTPILRSTDEVTMPAGAVITGTGATDNRDGSFGNVLSSRLNPGRDTCTAVNLAGVIDVSGSIDSNELAAYKNGINYGIDSLVGTGATLQLFTFGGNSPASTQSWAQPSQRLVVTEANAAILKAWVNAIPTSRGTQYTNWESGIDAVRDQGLGVFDAMLFLTDGAPNQGSGISATQNDTNVRALERAIYAANGAKSENIRVIGVGVDLDEGVVNTNLRAISDDGDFRNAETWQDLGNVLASLGRELSTCTSTVSIEKYDGTGPDDADAVLVPGWTVNTALAGAADGITIDPTTAQQTGSAGEAAKWTVTLPSESSTFNAVVSESEDNTPAMTFQTARYRIKTGATYTDWVSFDATSRQIDGIANGQDIEVEFYNSSYVPPEPAWTLAKTSDPESGTTVTPGDDITYTLTATNDSEATATNLVVTDDLSSVLNNAVLDEDSLPVGVTFDAETSTLTWTIGDLPAGENVSVSYTVTVNAGAYGVTLNNVANGDGDVPPSECTVEEPCETEHYTPEPSRSWTLFKESDPVKGSTVEPGQTITYKVTAKNTSDVALTDLVVTDDLSNVLNNAIWNDAVTAPAGTTPSFDAATSQLTWTIPTLAVGASAILEYTVTVNEDALGVTIGNVVTGEGIVPPSDCPETDPDCRETEHSTPAWDLVKSSDPADGSTVLPGSSVTYTLTATNTADVDLVGAVAKDDLSSVLNNAALDESSLPVGVTFDAATAKLTWTIPTVEPGASAEVSYTVTVNEDAYGVTIGNVVTGEGVVPPSDCPAEDPECRETEHFTPEWTLVKSSDPAKGSTVLPGQEITYTVTASNTSDADVANVVVKDNLSQVLNNASLIAGPTTEVGTAGIEGTELTWNVGTLVAGQTATVSYTVAVNEGALGVTIGNVVTGEGEVPPADCAVEDPECRETEHYTPSWSLVKDSDPASGETVVPGQKITYTVTASNTSDFDANNLVVIDDLSNVLNHAGWNAEVTAPDGTTTSFDEATSALTWNIPTLGAGQAAVLTYTVTVDADAVGVTIGNVVTGSGDLPPSDCPVEDPECRETEHHVPSWSLVKSSDPADGSTVAPGDEVTYTLTIKNTSDAQLKGLTATDDLSNVLNNATFVGVGEVTSGVVVAPIAGTNTLIWTIPGPLAPGATATAEYTVKVNADAIGVTIGNVVTGEGVVPPNPCEVDDPQCRETEHPVPAWDLVKSSDPVKGSTVVPGDTITYTLKATNTSDAVLSGAVAKDDMSKVLNNAALVEPLADGLAAEGTTLTWDFGTLEPGASATVSYQVVVNADAFGVDIDNVVTGEGPVPPNPCAEEDPECRVTDHHTPSWSLEKKSDPKSGSAVKSGQTVTYTLTATNTSNATVEGAKATDDLSKVLVNTALITPLDGALSASGTSLTWSIPTLKPGESASVSYQVKVKDFSSPIKLVNVVAPATPGGECLPNACTTNHTGNPPTLPNTGASIALPLGIGLALLLAGGFGIGYSRRRREG